MRKPVLRSRNHQTYDAGVWMHSTSPCENPENNDTVARIIVNDCFTGQIYSALNRKLVF